MRRSTFLKWLMDEAGAKQRFGAYSDFWTHYLNWGARHCPWSVEPILLTLYSFLFFLAARQFREGISANIRAIFPSASGLNLWWKTYQVFWNFSAVAVDGARAREEPSIVEWEIDGVEHFDELRACPTGVIIVTAHMGNYDMAGSVFASRFDRTVHAVRAPERNPELQAARQAELTANNDQHYQVIYNDPGNMLGITLAQALQRGEAVAIQADRVLFDVAPMTVEWDDAHIMDVPQGPFILSLTTGSPIYPLFMIRIGRCRYRVQIGEAFHCKRTGRDKQVDLERAGQEWVAILRATVTRHWSQWLVVETNIKVKTP
ncbi:MAG: lauroyl/myristoyl acyltransferase [Verrucomicrobiales bacterium]|jgi:lauroyl/myristoyl acyltransferase